MHSIVASNLVVSLVTLTYKLSGSQATKIRVDSGLPLIKH
jgi:hypothetical protein